MSNKQTATPSPESSFYTFLYQLIRVNRGSADNTGLIVCTIFLGFLAFVLTLVMPLIFIKIAAPASSPVNATITSTQENLPATK